MSSCFQCQSKNITISKKFKFFDKYHCNDCHFWTYQRIDSCCRAPFTIVTVHEYRSNAFMLYKQCISCGGALLDVDVLHSKEHSDNVETAFDLYRLNYWKEQIAEEHRLLARMKKEHFLHNGIWERFDNYIQNIIPKHKIYLYSEPNFDKPKIISLDVNNEDEKNDINTESKYGS